MDTNKETNLPIINMKLAKQDRALLGYLGVGNSIR